MENDVRLEFSNDADSEGRRKNWLYPWDTVVCFTYRLNPIKTNDHDGVFWMEQNSACTVMQNVKMKSMRKTGQDGYIVINRDSLWWHRPYRR
ncbi:MAG: hypothetical protein ACLTSC_00840 [Mediterraneibacter faecis]